LLSLVATSLLSLLNRRMLLCLLMGFSSGLPFYITSGMLQAWLRTRGLSLRDIGLFALTSVPYAWKFVWAPLLDRYTPPFLDRRRGWALGTQVVLAALVAAMGLFDPAESLTAVALLALAVAFFSATQDIALDAYRRELLPDAELGLGNSLFVNAYRVAQLVPGGLALILADQLPWRLVYPIVGGFMLVGILACLLAPSVEGRVRPPRSLREAIVGPFREFFSRQDLSSALLVLAFMLLYKLGDGMASALLTPFYLDVGFSMTQVGSVAKVVGLWASVVGSLIGGVAITKIGINRALWIFGLLQMAAIFGFVALARVGPDLGVLGVVVAFEYLGVGLGTSAFVAFLARATDKRFTATQFALFSSLVALSRTLASSSTGFLVELVGYQLFFMLCVLLGVPGMLLLLKVAPWTAPPPPPFTEADARSADAARSST
jgi:MFS transporter, PAT family, beta-lactamase induction signal transducer AmpG